MRSGNDDGEDDVLAPDSALDSDLEPDDEDDDAEVDAAHDGFQDPDGIVRLWFDGDELMRVRVSSRWRSKLGARTLDDCFSAAIMMASMRVAEVQPRSMPTLDDVDFMQLPPVSARSVAAFQKLFDDVEGRWNEALENYEARPPAPSTATSGRSQGVTAQLGPTGRLAKISFDTQWLEGAQAKTIRSQVIRAWQQARARFTPTEDDRAELDAVETEHQLMTAAFAAMLNPGSRSETSLQINTESTGGTA
ncbi:MAG: hypothetical protein ABIS84_09025 [Arachnia sp.]